MLYGTVEFGLKDGGESKVDWAARAHLVEEGGSVKMDFYQVYLVSWHGKRGEYLLMRLFRILPLWLRRSRERDGIAFVMPLEVARDDVEVVDSAVVVASMSQGH